MTNPVAEPILLCIDDEPNGLGIRKMLLESEGYSVLTAESGRQGLETFASHQVDAVILDYAMPGMNGYEVACEMKRIKGDVPILMLSAYSSLPREVLKVVDAFLTKGVPPPKLLEQLRALLAD